VREIVLTDAAPFLRLTITKRNQETDYAAKAVRVGLQRYIGTTRST
jgi:hypothetical protein